MDEKQTFFFFISFHAGLLFFLLINNVYQATDPRHLIHGHVLLHLRNGLARVETLGTGLCAVHNSMAAVDGVFVLEHIAPLSAKLVARVSHPAVGLHEHSRSKVLVLVPPV